MAPTSLFLLLLCVASTCACACATTAHSSTTAYWNQKITNSLPKPLTLFSQASPMAADEGAMFAQMIGDGTISDHLLTFCKEAHLDCDLTSLSKAARTQAKIFYANIATGFDFEKDSGIFFRESALKSGNVIQMPDISNKMPGTSFLPRTVASKLSFSSSKLTKMNQIFRAKENSPLANILARTVAWCDGAAIDGETKTCVSSMENMIDFATAILGSDVMVLSTKSSGGSKEQVVVGQVKSMGNKYGTKPVVCHQLIFPSALYYCHSFVNVQIYEVDIHDRNARVQINRAVAICHLNTSSWSPKHPAFLDLNSAPGLIEVCHWTNENNVIWKMAI